MSSNVPLTAETSTSHRSSPWIWLLPILAILVALWLGYRQFASQGPEVIVVFEDAAGVEAKKTLVRYKDVTVGRVEALEISDDLQNVIATIRLNKNFGNQLHDDTRFWVVQPRVTLTEVSGLDTLVSGTYIGIDPGAEGDPRTSYAALTKPPAYQSSSNGTAFKLVTNAVGRLDIGTPITFKQITVGELVDYNLTSSNAQVEFTAFINAPFDKLIQKNTRFWNASGIQFDINSSGVKADFDTIASIWAGSVTFETPLTLDGGRAAEPNDRFVLYDSRDAIDAPDLGRRLYYQMNFDGSLRGLNRGASIEFRGIRVGTVADVQVKVDPETLEVTLPVLASIEPGRLGLSEESGIDPETLIKRMVDRGLQAQLKTGSLITGTLYVELAETGRSATLVDAEPYPLFPTAPNQFDEITRGLTNLVDKVQNIPVDQISDEVLAAISAVRKLVESPSIQGAVNSASDTLKNIDKLTGTLSDDIAPITRSTEAAIVQANKALKALENAANGSQNWLGDQSPIVVQSSRLMREISDTARAVRDLVDYLERNPSSVIFGQ